MNIFIHLQNIILWYLIISVNVYEAILDII